MLLLIFKFFLFSTSYFYLEKPNKGDFIKIEKNVYYSKFEVSNNDYNEFLVNTNSEDQICCQIYSEEWKNIKDFKSFHLPFLEFYAVATQYGKHPVVNITQEGAKKYCLYLNKQNKLKGKKFKYRLPTTKEYGLAAKLIADEVDFKNELLAETGRVRDTIIESFGKKLKEIQDSDPNGLSEVYLSDESQEMLEYMHSSKYINQFIIQPTFFSKDPDVAIYNLFGNVSEWTSEDKIAMGGNWGDTEISYENLTRKTEEDFASAYIGFRVVKEIVE